MATALQHQLAQIAAKSTHQLDLKAQKSRHSQSLLFEPRDAASQSFDTLFEICVEEGFDELCQIDARFASFGSNIFANGSRDVDRTQLTAQENAELDDVLESFLILVQGRLLLKPAMKTLEWLVRRFRIHEYNSDAMLLAFLPYHAADMFSTVLSLISAKQLPVAFKWLHPYVTALQSPPRSAILAAITSNASLFSEFNAWVMRASNAKHQSAVLLGFWASLIAQAVNAMIDSTASGRDSVRQQREEDLLLRILPVLQSAFSTRGIPELYLGSCMIVTILVTKARLHDSVLDALMEAVVRAWTEETIEEGLICLAAIAEERDGIEFESIVIRTILKTDHTVHRLQAIGRQQRVNKLAAGIVCGAVKLGCKANNAAHITLAHQIFSTGLISEQQMSIVFREIIKSAATVRDTAKSGMVHEAITDMLEDCASSEVERDILEQVAKEANFDVQTLGLSSPMPDAARATNVEHADFDEPRTKDNDDDKQRLIHEMMQRLPCLSDQIPSFLDPALPADTWDPYLDTFQSALQLGIGARDISELIRAREDGRFSASLTFLMRAGTTTEFSSSVRASALRSCDTELRAYVKHTSEVDLQILLPYTLLALEDASAKVRRAAAAIISTIHKTSGTGPAPLSGDSAVRNRSASMNGDVWREVISQVILPILEDCVLDSTYIYRALPDILNNGTLTAEPTKQSQLKALKKSIRAELCIFFATHAVSTSAVSLQISLLKMLSKVGKSGMLARKDILLPFAKEWIQQSTQDVLKFCGQNGVQVNDLTTAVLSVVTHRTAEEIMFLKDIASGKSQTRREVQNATFNRIRQIFPYLKAEQYGMASLLLDIALQERNQDALSSSALDTLRILVLPADVLLTIVEELPSANSLQDHPPASKKQRTSRSDSIRHSDVDPAKLQSAVRKITLVLELVESSKPENHPQLLRGLFQLLNELHHFKNATGSDLVYLHQTLLGVLLSIVDAMSKSPQEVLKERVDQSAIRTDLIVECLRTAKSTQIHNIALLVVSKLATWQPEIVLHSVMPLFTFMSSTVLRQADDYSAHVADETVTKIVPPLAESLKSRGKNVATGAAELLLSFVAAYEHIPMQRRLPLFELLVSTLGQTEVLFAVLAMLAVRYGDDLKVMDFARDLAMSFEAAKVLDSAGKYVDLVTDGLQPKRSLSDTLLNFNEKTEDGVQNSVETLLDALADLLSRDALRSGISTNLIDKEGEQSQLIRDLYAQLLEKAVRLSSSVASNERLIDSSDSVLRSILGLLPTAEFISSSGRLMQSGSDPTRQQVFRSLEVRAHEAKRGNRQAQAIFLGVLPNCAIYIQPSQSVKTRNAAIACIHRISEKFGKADTSAVLQSAKDLVGDAALGSDERSLRISSLSALASIVPVLGDEAVAILPPLLMKCLNYLQITVNPNRSGTTDEQLVDVGSRLLNSVLGSLPWMLSGASLDSVIKIAAQFNQAAENPVHGIEEVEQLRSLLARKIAPSELFAALQRTWAQVLLLGQQAIFQQLSILHQAIKYHTKAIITKNAQVLYTVLLDAFDLRRHFASSHGNAGEDNYEELFTLVDRIAMDSTLKLNDATFRPFFIRAVDWAATSTPEVDQAGQQDRLMSVYTFSLTFFEQLQGLVTSYSGFLVDSAARLLEDGILDSNYRPDLLSTVLKTLSSSFRHDQDDFWQAPSHFEAMAGPLLQQLGSSARTDVCNTTIETFADFASAASSPEHLKSLNSSLMGLMRDAAASVRLAAVKCERAVTQKLGLEWLTLLPEMLPMISELMEDDDEDVEREVLRWVSEIELATGESLEGMLS